jgi:hypothetical protein
MKFEKIIVGYWHGKIYDCKFEHNTEFPYSSRKQASIIKYLLEKGLSVMLRPTSTEPILRIWIDNGRFGQR